MKQINQINKPASLQNSMVAKVGLSDFHKLNLNIRKALHSTAQREKVKKLQKLF